MEIVRWISIGLSWVSLAINVVCSVRAMRIIRKYQNKLREIMKESENENTES